MAIEEFWLFNTRRSNWEASKGKGMSYCVVCRRKKRRMVDESWVKLIEGIKEIEVSTLARSSLPSKRMGYVGASRKD